MTSDGTTFDGAGHDRHDTAGSGDAPALVSVIIRSIGRDSLSEALDSVAAQTYPNIEVIVVNAAGPDHASIPEGCGRFPLRVVGGAEPLARSRAANVGLDAARGDSIAFLDDDDGFYPGHIEGLQGALVENRPDALCAYAGVERRTGTGNGGRVFNRPFSYPRLCIGNYIPIHAALFARDLTAAGCRFDEALEQYEDWDFWLQLAGRTKFVHVDHVSAWYRSGGTSRVGLAAEEETHELWRATILEKWKQRWTGAEIDAVITFLQDRIRERDARLELHEDSLEECDEKVELLEAQVRQLERRMENVLGSASWRATAPFRGIAAFLRGGRRGES